MTLPDVFQDHDKPERMYAAAGLGTKGIVAKASAVFKSGRSAIESSCVSPLRLARRRHRALIAVDGPVVEFLSSGGRRTSGVAARNDGIRPFVQCDGAVAALGEAVAGEDVAGDSVTGGRPSASRRSARRI